MSAARWRLNGCDPAGVPWEVGTFADPRAALDALEVARAGRGPRPFQKVFWLDDPDDPEAGDREDAAWEALEPEDEAS